MSAPIPARAIGVAAGFVAALVTYFIVVRPLQTSRKIREEEKEIFILTATLLWGIMIQELIAYLYTNNAKTVAPIVAGVVSIVGVRTPANEVFTAVVCWLAIGLLWLLVNRTRAGKVLLAASINPRGVTLLGVELSQVYIAIWAIYGILAGIAGVLLGMFLGVSSYSVGPLTASAFAIVVLGGLGSVSGALVAAYVVGYLETITAYLISPAYRTIPALSLLVAVMYVQPARPTGAALRCAHFPPCACWLIFVGVVVAGGVSAARRVRLHSRPPHRRLLLRRVRDGLGSAVRLRRRGQFRADLPDRRRRLYRRHPRQSLPAADLALPGRRRARRRTGGVVLALPALRVRGPYFGLTTLVAVLMLQNFIVVAASLTGGEIGLTVPDVISISDTTNYEIALWFMAVSGAILFALSRSPVGLILQASGQDAVQAGALGFNVVKHKLAAFIISAFFSGLAGALLVFYLGTASVDNAGRYHRRRADHHRRRDRRPAHHPRRGARRDLSDRHERIPAPARRSLELHRICARARAWCCSSPSGFFGLLTRTKENA